MKLTSPYLSPLRYPGGKAALGPFVGDVLEGIRPRKTTYVEPFSGGAGVGLYLLINEYVERIILNDLDRGVAAFWRAVFQRPEELAERIETCEITIRSWWNHWETYKREEGDDLHLGFATLFLNRTNRSGILTARPIGGLRQKGPWKIDARFNRKDLASRVRRLARYAGRVEVREENAVHLLQSTEWLGQQRDSLIYADPPYLSKGSGLYLNSLRWEDHQAIAARLTSWGGSWMVTYDHDDRVWQDLYPACRCAEYRLSHSASSQHFSNEYILFSDSLRVTCLERVGPHGAQWLSREST